MRLRELIQRLESWFPSGTALPGDNPGLQVGDPERPVTRIIVTLDVTDSVIQKAIQQGAEVILSHHPLIFKPLTKLDAATPLGRKISLLLRHDLAVFSAHTNLDASPEGVSIVLARQLGVENPRFLTAAAARWLKKLVVFVPADYVDPVRQALAEAGAGVIGNYTQCSFNLTGLGTFFGEASASPQVGRKGKLEKVEEVRLEMIIPAWTIQTAVRRLKAVHPYEEVACDIYPLEHDDVNYGFGAIGELIQPVPVVDFIQRVKRELNVSAVGFIKGPKKTIRRVAVCGGSGGDLAEAAWQQGAEVFLTGEMKYHTLLDYQDRLTLVLAGHYATEQLIVPVLVQRLRQELKEAAILIYEAKKTANILRYL